jgi:hypothetical protein
MRKSLVLLAALAALLAPASPALAEEGGPVYSLSADAATSLVLAAEGLDPTAAGTAAVFGASANFLHRVEAQGWGLVLSHAIDLGAASAPAGVSGIQGAAPVFTVYEAYARLDASASTQFFLGKRRMGLGIGTTFAPGDGIDPRSGFWDQKNGFRGLGASFSLGSDLSLRLAASLDRSFDAYAAGLAAKAAAAQGAASPAALAARAAYAAALGDASGPADPRLIAWAASAEAQAGSLQLAAAGTYSPDYSERPSLGLSLDLGGLILQAEGAVELRDGPYWFATGGARETWSKDDASLTLSLDYDYNGEPGLLKHTHYLLPSARFAWIERFELYARALVELEAPSALLSTGLTFYPVQGFDIELTGTFALGAGGEELAALPAPPSPTADPARNALGIAARVHF